ncbi:hypothetical protein ACLKA6_013129 [Drosophila palustris]
MKSMSVFLSCALLAILIAQLPTGDAVTCAVEPDNEDCVDCTDPINAEDAECLAEEEEEATTTTEAATLAPGASTTRRTRPTRRPGWGRPRPGWRRRRTTTVRPRTILGSIIQKKIDFLNRLQQPRPRLMG